MSSPSRSSGPVGTSPGGGMPALGVMLPRDLRADLVIPFARRAEELGFAELWVVEDLGFRGGIAQAATALAVTGRIRVGIGLLPVAVRNVAFTAMEINSLAELYPGRVDVGLGHGIPGWLRSAGTWPEKPFTCLREHLDALRALLAGETVTRSGTYVRLDEVRLESPAPVPPQLLVGARSPRTLALAGTDADGTVLAEPATPEYLRTALQQVSPPPGHRVVAYDLAAVDDDPVAARERVRPGLAWVGDPEWAVHIDPLDLAEEFRSLRAGAVDRAAFTAALPDAWVDRLAVVGTPDSAREQVRLRGAAGATTVVLIPVGTDPLADLESLGRIPRGR